MHIVCKKTDLRGPHIHVVCKTNDLKGLHMVSKEADLRGVPK